MKFVRLALPVSSLALMLAAVATPAAAAPAASNSIGRATVLTQLTLRKTGDLDFGTVVRGATAGQVTVNPNTNARTATGGAVLAGGTPAASVFELNGTANRLVRITVTPGSTTLTNGTGGTITVNTFRLNGAANRRLSAAGTATIRVGARLNLAANQADGVYSGTFNLTVNYQ